MIDAHSGTAMHEVSDTGPASGQREDDMRTRSGPSRAPETPGTAPARRPEPGEVNTTDPRVAEQVRADMMDNLKVLRAFAISLTRNGASADDLVQETILKAWSNLHRFQPGTNMRAWLFTILRNTFYSDCRKAGREVSDSDGEIAGQLASKPSHDGHLNLRDFRTAFAKLPDEQREVLILVGAMGYAYDEAAEMCGVKIGTIKSRLNRGRERLALLMDLDPNETMELTDRVTASVLSEQGHRAV